MAMRKYIVALGLVVAVLLVAGVAIFGVNGKNVSYRLAKVESGPIISVVGAAGTVELAESYPVVARIAGVITAVDVDFNTQVQPGDVLVRLNAEDASARLQIARADLNVARGAVEIAASQIDLARRQVENARAAVESARTSVKAAGYSVSDADRDLAIKRQLAQTGDAAPMETERARTAQGRASNELAAAKAREQSAVASFAATQAQLDVSESQFRNSQATLAAREVAVSQAESDVERTTIRAPVAGIVMASNAVVGRTVNIGEVLFTLAPDLRQVKVQARIDEADIGRIAPDQVATFVFGAFPGQAFQGKVADVRKTPQIAEGLVTYVVEIVARNDELKLLPGMTASVNIIVDSRAEALKVPRAALRFVPAAVGDVKAVAAPQPPGNDTVWRLRSGSRPEAVPIRTGISDGVFTEVVEGALQPGEEIIVGVVETTRNKSGGPLRF
jgi:HlyD family secretion protein